MRKSCHLQHDPRLPAMRAGRPAPGLRAGEAHNLLALGTSLDIDVQRRDAVTTPESLLLKRIEEELIVISESQHVQARQAAVLRKARTLLHVGCSTIEVNAMLAEHLRKERAQGTSSARTRTVRKLQLAPRAALPGDPNSRPLRLGRGKQVTESVNRV
jgi:hypothetical protein